MFSRKKLQICLSQEKVEGGGLDKSSFLVAWGDPSLSPTLPTYGFTA